MRSLRKNLEAVPGKHSIDSPQKPAVLWTAHTIRKVLQCETGRESGGDRHWFKGRSAAEKGLRQEAYNNNNNRKHPTSRNYTKQPFWGLHTLRKVLIWKYRTHLTREMA